MTRPREFDNFEEAFSHVRSRNSPQLVLIDKRRYKLYPSGTARELGPNWGNKPCGCYVQYNDTPTRGFVHIVYCPVHAAAQEMHVALEVAQSALQDARMILIERAGSDFWEQDSECQRIARIIKHVNKTCRDIEK